MVSGYCQCGFPASTKCPKCLAKLCGNCVATHKCRIEFTLDEVKPTIAIAEERKEPADEPAPVNQYKKKPGRPPQKK